MGLPLWPLSLLSSLNRTEGVLETGWRWAALGLGPCLVPKKIYKKKLDFSSYQILRVLPPSQIVSHSKNLGESNFSKFNQIYIIK